MAADTLGAGETEAPEKTQPGKHCFIDVETLTLPPRPALADPTNVPLSIHLSLRWNHSKMRHQEPGHLVFASALGQIPSQLPWVWRKQNHDEADLYSAN